MANKVPPIERILYLTEKVVDRLSYRRAIPFREKDDVKQEIIRKYLDKKEHIFSVFKGDANPDTYYTAVLYRMACEIIRSGQKSWDHVYSQDEAHFTISQRTYQGTENEVIIENEKNYLFRILDLFDNEKPKVILFLKCLFAVHVREKDLAVYAGNYNELGLKELLIKDFHSKQEVFKTLAEAQRRVENTTVKSDAVRMWTYKRIDQIISRLNGTHHRSNYDRDSLQVLFEYAFAED